MSRLQKIIFLKIIGKVLLSLWISWSLKYCSGNFSKHWIRKIISCLDSELCWPPIFNKSQIIDRTQHSATSPNATTPGVNFINIIWAGFALVGTITLILMAYDIEHIYIVKVWCNVYLSVLVNLGIVLLVK